MERKIIRRVGSVTTFPSFPDGPGMRVTKEFLDQLIAGFARQCEKYMKITEEAPFAFHERQVHSFLAPALAQCTDLLLMESPVLRKWSQLQIDQIDSHGWVDYWCYLRNLVLLVELKHGFCSLRNCKATKNLQKGWERAIEQLNAIEQEALAQSEWSKGTVRIALYIIPLYESFSKRDVENNYDFNYLKESANQVIESLEPKPNWFGLWLLHEKLIGPYEYGERKEMYPAVLLIAYVYDMVAKT